MTLGGVDIGRWPAHRRALGGLVHIPEGRGIFPTLQVDESLQLAAAMTAGDVHAVHERIDEVYAVFPQLRQRRRQQAGTLSGGEQQMLILARGIIARPQVLLVDEMSQGLAPTLVAELFERVRRFPEQGTAVLLVEQFVSEALSAASRAYVMEKGTITYGGAAATLAADPEFVRNSYLGSGRAAVVGTDGESSEVIGEDVKLQLPARRSIRTRQRLRIDPRSKVSRAL